MRKKRHFLYYAMTLAFGLATIFIIHSCSTDEYYSDELQIEGNGIPQKSALSSDIINNTNLLIDSIAISDEFWEFEINSKLLSDKFQAYTSTLTEEEYDKLMENLNDDDYMEEFISQMMEVSIKQIYGWVAYACIFLFLLLLLYDFPVRRSLKSMPSWKEVARDVKNSFWRTAQGTSKKINN